MNTVRPRTALILAVSISAAGMLAACDRSAKTPVTNEAVDLGPVDQVLFEQKKVSQWPVKAGTLGDSVVELTDGECRRLGLKVEYWPSCAGTHLKCVGVGGHETCIDSLTPDDQLPK